MKTINANGGLRVLTNHRDEPAARPYKDRDRPRRVGATRRVVPLASCDRIGRVLAVCVRQAVKGRLGFYPSLLASPADRRPPNAGVGPQPTRLGDTKPADGGHHVPGRIDLPPGMG